MSKLQDTIALIPAYQCEHTVGEVVRGVQERGLRVVVVDDGSRDATAPAARQAGAIVVQHAENRGKGSALVTGFEHALRQGARHVVTLDADGQHDPGDLPALLARRDRADLVVGQRIISREVMPRSSFIGNSISTFFISLFCRSRVHDSQCGYRVYSARLLRQVPLRRGRFQTETELLMRAILLGLRVDWVPVATLYEDGPGPRKTHFDNLRDPLRVIAVVLRSPFYPRGRA